jgi:hypothetical protein
MADKQKIVLELDRKSYPLVLRQYGLEGAKAQAISMCLAQKREITAANLYSCLSTLESGLQEMFPQPLTREEKEEAKREAREEAEYYQSEIAEMKPYMVDGKQLKVTENGEWGVNQYGEPIAGAVYPVWETKSGELTARIYNEGWDWIFLDMLEDEDEEDD